MKSKKKSRRHHRAPHPKQIDLISVYKEQEASLRKVEDGVRQTIKDYIDDLVLLGKE